MKAITSKPSEVAVELDNHHALIQSWSDEIQSRINRVRNLIGAAHWPTDGHYKEKIITDFIAAKIPNRFAINGGFVISPFVAGVRSREIDILIADSWAEPFPLNEHGTLISYPNSAVVQIQVKSAFGKTEISDVLDALGSARFVSNSSIWSGGVFLAGSQFTVKKLHNFLIDILLKISKYDDPVAHMPNCFVVLGSYYIIFREKKVGDKTYLKATLFDFKELAFGVFFSNILQHLYSVTSGAGMLRIQKIISSPKIQPLVEETIEI